MNCKHIDRLYSLIHVLRSNSFCTAPADITTILSEMNKRRKLSPDSTPSTTSTRRLLSSPPPADDARQMRRTISGAEEFLADEYNCFKDLLLFRIIRSWKDDDILCSEDSDHSEQNTRKGLFHLTYRKDPSADHDENIPYVSDDEHQFRISARWQLILDFLSSLPCINSKDAANLTNVISRTCTLGEIPLRTPQDRDGECINFSVLSQLTRHFQIAHKAASLPDPVEATIPCMDITIGRYDSAPNGSLHLVPGQTVTAYPTATFFRDGIYYLSVMTEEENGFIHHHLRADHILDCKERQDLPRHSLTELSVVHSTLCEECSHYQVTDCPESTLVAIVDRFGKHRITNSARSEIEGETLWRFTISIPKTAVPVLLSLHSEVKKM